MGETGKSMKAEEFCQRCRKSAIVLINGPTEEKFSVSANSDFDNYHLAFPAASRARLATESRGCEVLPKRDANIAKQGVSDVRV